MLFFLNIFHTRLGALKFFQNLLNLEDFEHSAQLEKHAEKVIGTVNAAFSLLGDLGTLVPILQDLGNKHVKYGVLPEHYPLVGNCLVQTVATALKEDFTTEVEDAYLVLWAVIETTMIGDHYN